MNNNNNVVGKPYIVNRKFPTGLRGEVGIITDKELHVQFGLSSQLVVGYSVGYDNR